MWTEFWSIIDLLILWTLRIGFLGFVIVFTLGMLEEVFK